MSARKALVIGINHYAHVSPLYGCVADANRVNAVLERNADGSINFSTILLTGIGPTEVVNRSQMRLAIKELFEGDSEVALLYFAGHGHIESTGGYLMASDSISGDEGVSLNDVMRFANDSSSKNRIIVLDSCYSGTAAASGNLKNLSEIAEGTTILTASTAEQYANEENGQGVFTSLLVDALSGGASNLVGAITPGSVYAHIDQSLGPWEQRPVFKTNVTRFVSLRRVQAPIDLQELHKIPELFPDPGYELKLDPSFEPKRNGTEANVPPPDPVNNAKFATLQRCNKVGLVAAVGTTHMYDAAMESRSCRLTVLGEHYRNLVLRKRI
ncbi:MAG TPA: caspase family protein [Nitrospira sp.]|nr:caspase family protein [Nitrospira sp.]